MMKFELANVQNQLVIIRDEPVASSGCCRAL